MDAEERKTAMSHDEMQDYWKTLCSFTGEDIPNEVNQLMVNVKNIADEADMIINGYAIFSIGDEV